ncbi:MAG TPA: FHA domain-containing protein [Solirubrobacteraceae bacterium]|nr:FHA domain-containing protein [Solirubrobacteraceae bacterium]
MSALADDPHPLDDTTAALEAAPHGDDHRGDAGLQLAPGRYLLQGSTAFALTADVTHVGRGIAADVRLDDHTVSARHAILVLRADRLRILDDRSTNGTVVNGRRIEEAELCDGDVVVLGRVVLTYRLI